jgi:hypothetical protein
MRVLVLSIILVVSSLGCGQSGDPSFDLPPLGGDGKADETTTELPLERVDANGSAAEWSGAIPEKGEAAVAVIDFFDLESTVQLDVEVDSGEPHLYVRKADDGSTALESHAPTTSGSFGISSDGGGRYQLALFVTNSSGGNFAVHIRQNSACAIDDDAAEPNETAMMAAPATDGLHDGVVCNGADSFDADYFRLTVDEPDRILRVGFQHVVANGPLNLVVEGPFGPLELTRTERPGTSLGGPVTLAIDRAAEPTAMGDEYTIGVWGDELYNVYTLMTCLDDGLEDDSGSIGNQDEASASPLEIGTAYQRGVLCPVMGRTFDAAEPDDADYYAVDVPADSGLRIRVDTPELIRFQGPADTLEVGPDTYELSSSPTARHVVFGLTAGNLDAPAVYDLTVEAI